MSDLTTRMMRRALAQAQHAEKQGEVPIGAVICTAEGEVLAEAYNLVENQKDSTAHAEMIALRAAMAKTGSKYLENCTIFVTLEPCAMCAQALAHARISSIIFGAYDPKSGGTVNNARVLDYSHHKPQVIGGIEENACKQLLQAFFRACRTPESL